MDPWRELEEAEEIEFEFYAELMQEPPGGECHGWRKGEGEWLPLGIPRTADGEALSGPKLAPPRKHGTAYVANKLRCGCKVCRAWRGEHQRRMYLQRKQRRINNPK